MRLRRGRGPLSWSGGGRVACIPGSAATLRRGVESSHCSPAGCHPPHSTPRPSWMLGFPENWVTHRLLNRVTGYSLSQIEASRSEFFLLFPKIAGASASFYKTSAVSWPAFLCENSGGAGRSCLNLPAHLLLYSFVFWSGVL